MAPACTPRLDFLGSSCFAEKTAGQGCWIVLDFLGFSCPNLEFSIGYTRILARKVRRDFPAVRNPRAFAALALARRFWRRSSLFRGLGAESCHFFTFAIPKPAASVIVRVRGCT